jgi:hypothetical protein
MRKYLVAALSLTLVLLGLFVNLLTPRHCPVNREAFGLVEKGMTRAEVHAVLGGPPGDYRTRPYSEENALAYYATSPGPPSGDVWHGDEGTVEVRYSTRHDAVISADFTEAEPYDAGPLELVRWRLERLWAKLVP